MVDGDRAEKLAHRTVIEGPFFADRRALRFAEIEHERQPSDKGREVKYRPKEPGNVMACARAASSTG
jgi:hypothetical protein